MTEEQTYAVWAPLESPWAPWAKPVLFAQLERVRPGPAGPAPEHVTWENAAELAKQNLAIILDLPGENSVALGLQLAAAGFRPVPLFNTSYGFNAVVPVQDTITALAHGAGILANLALRADAPPVFLLDSNRMRTMGGVFPGKYDNRWLVFPQDFPSGKFLLSQQVKRVLLIQEQEGQPQEDLAHVLLRWQEARIPILSASVRQPHAPHPIVVTKPSHYRTLWHHFLATIGLRRNSAGGFGSVVPEPSQGGRGG